jgi:hypothetical protein
MDLTPRPLPNAHVFQHPIDTEKPNRPFGTLVPDVWAIDQTGKMEKKTLQALKMVQTSMNETAKAELEHCTILDRLPQPRPIGTREANATNNLRATVNAMADWTASNFRCEVIAATPDTPYRDMAFMKMAEELNIVLFRLLQPYFTWEGAQLTYRELQDIMIDRLRQRTREVFKRPDSHIGFIEPSVVVIMGWHKVLRQHSDTHRDYHEQLPLVPADIDNAVLILRARRATYTPDLRQQARTVLNQRARDNLFLQYLHWIGKTTFEVARQRFELVARALAVAQRLIIEETDWLLPRWWYVIAKNHYRTTRDELRREVDAFKATYRQRAITVCAELGPDAVAPFRFNAIAPDADIETPDLFHISSHELNKLQDQAVRDAIRETGTHYWLGKRMPPMPEGWTPPLDEGFGYINPTL